MAENYFCILSGAAVLDMYTGRIPNALILAGLLCGCFSRLLRAGPVGLVEAVAAGMLILVVCYPIYLLRGLGAGDIKLFCVIGTYTGLMTASKIIVASLFLGAVLGVISRMIHREKKRFVFSPAILISAVWLCKSLT